MLRSSRNRIAVAILVAVCTLTAQGQSDNNMVSVTISNCTDATLHLFLNTVVKTPVMPPPWITNAAGSAPRVASNTNQHWVWLEKEILPKQPTTIEIPPDEYQIKASGKPSWPLEHPIRVKVALDLHGYLSVTNTECWVFSLPLSKKWETEGRVFEFWQWHLEVPSRPGFQLSLTRKQYEIPMPQLVPLPPPLGYRRSETDPVRLPLPASKATPTNSER
jgi:hypothetical protein